MLATSENGLLLVFSRIETCHAASDTIIWQVVPLFGAETKPVLPEGKSVIQSFRDIYPDKASSWGCWTSSKPCICGVHVKILKVKLAKGESFQTILKWFLWNGKNGRKFKKKKRQQSYETRDPSKELKEAGLQSQRSGLSTLGSHFWLDSGPCLVYILKRQ